MSMADMFSDSLSAVDQLDAATSLTRERRTELCSVIREALLSIQERIAPGDEHDLDSAIILPTAECLTVEEHEATTAFLRKARTAFEESIDRAIGLAD